MNCPSCGAECAGGARFCWSCGQSLRAPSEERRVVTVVFADLVGFTSLSERLDPERVKRIVDTAFEGLVRDVTAFGGRVDKIVGDAIVALFGAPVAHEDDAERAVRAALRMQETLATYSEDSGVDIRMRIGVNTGEVLVGGLRAGGDYTAMGDVVNTASRLQTVAGPGEVLVGDVTHAATVGVIDFENRGSVIIRGRAEPVDVWRAQRALLPPGYRLRPRLSPLVGRESEMEICTNAIRVSIDNGRALIVIVLGEAGVGKTRLATEITTVAEDDLGVATYSGRCVPYGEANPWWPISEALRSATGVTRTDDLEQARAKTLETVLRQGTVESPDETGADEAGVVDGLLHLMGHEGPLRSFDGPRVRAEATSALIAYLEGAVARRPLLVRLADLHWADQAVFELIDDVSERMARCPIVFIATGRGSLRDRWSPRSGRYNTLVLNLDPLDRSSSSALLDSLVAADLDESTRNVVLDRSGGNPLYLEELVSVMSQQTAAVAIDGAAPTVADLPDTLRGVVAARLDGLSADEQLVVEDASVWGTSGPLMALDRLAEATRSVDDVSAVAQSLADKDVLVVDATEWAFRSNLVREIAYTRLTKRDRFWRHSGIAFYLEEHKDDGRDGRPDDWLIETTARHYLEAARLIREIGDVGKVDVADLNARAVKWVSEAARRAEDATSWPTAVRLYGEALELLAPTAPDPSPEPAWNAEQFGLLLGRARARGEVRDFEGARDDGLAALALAELSADPRATSQALVRLGVAEVRSGRLKSGDDALSKALALADDHGDVAARAEALRQRGMAFLMLGDQRSAEEPIAAALDAFHAVGDRRGEAWALQNLAWIALSDGRPALAAEHIEASIVAFREVGDRGGLAWATGLSAFVHLQQGELDQAELVARQILRESIRRGDRFGEGMMHVVLGAVSLWSGHPHDAVESADLALDALRSVGDTVGLEQALALRGRAAVMTGDIERGRRSLDEALHVGIGTSTTFAEAVRFATEIQLGFPDTPGLAPVGAEAATSSLFVGQHFAATALALALSGRFDEALDVARAAVSGAADGYGWSTFGVVAAAAGDPVEAADADLRVGDIESSTYLDRTMARLGVALSDLGDRGSVALAAAREELAGTEDVVTATLVDLAARIRADAVTGADRAETERIDRELDALGIADTRWRDVYVTAVERAADRRSGPPTRTIALS